MASTRELRRKIKSIKGTQKLTQAMQMVSAAKMNRAIQRAEASRTYSGLSWSIIQELLVRVGRDKHPLLDHRATQNVAIIVISSNRGLAGGLNTQLLRKVSETIKERQGAGKTVSVFSMGKKSTQFIARYYGDTLKGDFPTPDTVGSMADITDLATITIDGFLDKKYDEVVVCFNEFKSMLSQVPTIRTLLPVKEEDSSATVSFRGADEKSHSEKSEISHSVRNDTSTTSDVIFEPSQERVLDVLLPRAVRTQLYQMLLDANASEHAARMLAMKNATENAGEIIDDLTLTMNGVRQAGITREISEISAGAEALKA